MHHDVRTKVSAHGVFQTAAPVQQTEGKGGKRIQ
jgi:hypothetical protein